MLSVNSININFVICEVLVNDNIFSLIGIEYEIFVMLVDYVGEVISKE